MLTTQDATELVNALADLETPVSVEDCCDALRDAANAREAEDTAQKEACAELQAKIDAIAQPYKERKSLYGELQETAKLRIVAAIEADDKAQRDAIKAAAQLPPKLELPKGLSMKRETLISVPPNAVDLLDESYLRLVPDMKAIEADVRRGKVIEHVTTQEEISVSLNRANYRKGEA